MLNYLFHWKLEDPLESAAETFFSYPPSYMYSVRATGERFRSFEADHKIAYQEFLEKKLVEQFNKHFVVVVDMTVFVKTLQSHREVHWS
jgi:hypothetical protein